MKPVIIMLAALGVACTAASGAPVILNSVPDWHQACLIGGNWGPNNGGNPPAGAANYKAWCTPTAAANVMGYWQDVVGCNVADGAVYASCGLTAWTPPVPNNWQDYEADASSIPTVGGGVRAAGQDLGWHLNTNDQGDQTLPANGAGAGETFRGTKRANVVQGLTNFLTAHGYPGASVLRNGGGAAAIQAGWNDITNEIDAGRPLLGHFDHFNIFSIGDPVFEWGDPTGGDSGTGEEWDPANGLGHTTTIVGYASAGDAANPWANTHAIIVQDNRLYGWEGPNCLGQIWLPFATPRVGAPWMALAPWNSNTLINVPEPTSLLLLSLAGLALLHRRH